MSNFILRSSQSGYIDIPAKMYRRDSTKKLPIESESIDLIITSPPYVTSYEYADLHQLSLLWFGDDPKHFKKVASLQQRVYRFSQKFHRYEFKKRKKRRFQ